MCFVCILTHNHCNKAVSWVHAFLPPFRAHQAIDISTNTQLYFSHLANRIFQTCSELVQAFD